MIRCAFVVVALCMLSCGDEEPAPATSSRVNAVMANDRQRPLDSFCDAHATEAAAQAFSPPALAEGHGLPASTAGRWRWINVWATWCHPCVEEFNAIGAMRDRLAAEGAVSDLVYLSVDASQDEVDRFAATHPSARSSARLAEASAIPQLISALGLDPGASIPIHAFVDPNNKIRCVRTGTIENDHFDFVKRVLHGE